MTDDDLPTLRSASLSPNRRYFTAEWETPQGILTTRLTWPHPCTDDELAAALRPRPLPRMAVGESRRARRIIRGGWTLWLHRMTGPPTWWVPRLFPHQGALVVGWLRLGYAVKLERTR